MLTFRKAIEEQRVGVAPHDKEGAKAGKSSVGYTDDSQSSTDRCALCEHYETEGARMQPIVGTCAKVRGDIDPFGWCQLFELQYDWAKSEYGRSEEAETGDPLIDFILQFPITSRNIDDPIIDRSRPTPYGAGGSIPLENPVTFIDPSVPHMLVASGVRFDPADAWVVHENVEQRAMDLLITVGIEPELAYRFSHFCIAEVAEAAWYRFHGIDPAEAEAVEKPILDRLRTEQIGHENENPALYVKPYPHDCEALARTELGPDLAPTPEEEKRCRGVLMAVLDLQDTDRELPVNQQDLEKAVLKYLGDHAPEIARLVKEQPALGDVHATTALGNEEEEKMWPAAREAAARARRGKLRVARSRHARVRHTRGKARSFRSIVDSGYSQDDDYDTEKIWASNADLPEGVKGLPQEAQSVFRRVANDRMKAGAGDVSAIRQAWTAVKNGWKKEGDNWVRKAGGNFEARLDICKLDDEKQQIFGWASVTTIDGEEVIDKQGDIIPTGEIEKAAYEFVQFSRDMGDMHSHIGTGRMIESVVFTKEKAACGITAKDDQGKTIEGWWVGFHVIDPEAWKSFKTGQRPELSIGGRASWGE